MKNFFISHRWGGGCRRGIGRCLSKGVEDTISPVPRVVLLAPRSRGESWWVRGNFPPLEISLRYGCSPEFLGSFGLSQGHSVSLRWATHGPPESLSCRDGGRFAELAIIYLAALSPEGSGCISFQPLATPPSPSPLEGERSVYCCVEDARKEGKLEKISRIRQ